MIKLNYKQYYRQRRTKNWTVFAILVGLVVLFFVLTVVKMGAANG